MSGLYFFSFKQTRYQSDPTSKIYPIWLDLESVCFHTNVPYYPSLRSLHLAKMSLPNLSQHPISVQASSEKQSLTSKWPRFQPIPQELLFQPQKLKSLSCKMKKFSHSSSPWLMFTCLERPDSKIPTFLSGRWMRWWRRQWRCQGRWGQL